VLEDLVDHAGQLVLQMLSIAGQGPSAMRPLNLNQVLEELIHLLRSSLPGKTALRYDPEPDLGRIQARLTAVNFADDLVNPIEINLMEKLVGKVPGGRLVLIQADGATLGHLNQNRAVTWKNYLAELLR